MRKKQPLVMALLAAGLTVGPGGASAQQGQEQLATLASIEGETMISRGARYVSATEGMRLVDGQRVMAVREGAVIQYDDGCRYELEEGQLLLIEDQSPCALGILPVATGSLAWVPPAGVAGVVVLGAILDTGSDDRRVEVRQRESISP